MLEASTQQLSKLEASTQQLSKLEASTQQLLKARSVYTAAFDFLKSQFVEA